MKVLITGGAGFIGSTIASCCQDNDITPIVLDGLSSGREEFVSRHNFYRGDIGDGTLVDKIFIDHPDIAAVVHCAAKITVPESMVDPVGYYENNVAKSISLVRALLRNGCGRFLFSSTAAMYEPGEDFSVDESSEPNPQSPYARTKLMLEHFLADVPLAEPFRVLSLRYFNPIGSDPKFRTGLQNPYPSHALGKLIQAFEKGEAYTLMGVDWPTRDGSTIRDYIHVWDLARAHVAALLKFDQLLPESAGHDVINLGTGTGTTVRELIASFEQVTDGKLNVVEAPRRAGDVIGCFTRTEKANRLLDWKAEKTLADGIRDSLAWSAKRPEVLGE
ncbi:UDP-glucose 4-epimerase GalE [Streptomyces decoyicus]|uniref:UDP-glucose 4-epimerase GalE n=1 Tax=Streptomyces decoyicus TaxID=249567 RepID=UPI0037F44B46